MRAVEQAGWEGLLRLGHWTEAVSNAHGDLDR